MKHIDELDLVKLEERLGPLHAKQRLGIEFDHEAHIIGQGINFSHPENWYSIHPLIEIVLKLSGLYWRGLRNARRVALCRNELQFDNLPPSFDSFTILQISDLHLEMNEEAMRGVGEQVRELNYDICVLTGDFRGETHGSYHSTLAGIAKLRELLREPIYGVLGNHDTIRIVPGLEAMGIRMLLNESVSISRGGQAIFVAGIDDAHYYRVDNFEKAVSQIPEKAFGTKVGYLSAQKRWLWKVLRQFDQHEAIVVGKILDHEEKLVGFEIEFPIFTHCGPKAPLPGTAPMRHALQWHVHSGGIGFGPGAVCHRSRDSGRARMRMLGGIGEGERHKLVFHFMKPSSDERSLGGTRCYCRFIVAFALLYTMSPN